MLKVIRQQKDLLFAQVMEQLCICTNGSVLAKNETDAFGDQGNKKTNSLGLCQGNEEDAIRKIVPA